MRTLHKKLDHRESDGVTDRRDDGRRSIRREGWLRTRDGTVHGVVVLDVSAGGAGIAMLVAHALEIDDVVELSIDQPGGDSWLSCTVKWRVRDRLGVAFRVPAAATLLASVSAPRWRVDE